MEFKLNFEIQESSINLSYDDSFVLIGSCFSDEIGDKLRHTGFKVDSNSFGTLFHPTAIANVIKSSLEENENVDIFQRDDLFFSWDSASKVYAYTEKDLIEATIELRKQFCSNIKSAGSILITFGTAWKYDLISTGKTVGNCHKAAQSLFNKSLSKIEELSEEWNSIIDLIRSHNPSAKIIFTVSPVRHIKDGLIENNRSKARLIELVNNLVSYSDVSYFPSYEILMDELRDYRYYEEDLVHPSKLAVQYIWERFIDFSFSKEAKSIMKERAEIVNQLTHKSLYPDSQAEIKRQEVVELKLKQFQSKYPNISI